MHPRTSPQFQNVKCKQIKEIASLVVGLHKVHVVNSHQLKRKADRLTNEGFCGTEFYLHSFLKSAFERSDRLGSCPGHFTIGKKSSRYTFNSSLGSPQGSESLTHGGQALFHLPPGLALSKYKLCHTVHLVNLYSHQKNSHYFPVEH